MRRTSFSQTVLWATRCGGAAINRLLTFWTWRSNGSSRQRRSELTGAAAPAPWWNRRLPRARLWCRATIFDALRLTPGQPVLCTSPEDESFAAARPRSGPDPLIRLTPATFATLGLEKLDVPLCGLHVPLGAAAVEAAQQLLRQPRQWTAELGADPFVDRKTSRKAWSVWSRQP